MVSLIKGNGVVQAGCISRSVPVYLKSICKKSENKFNSEMAWLRFCFDSKSAMSFFFVDNSDFVTSFLRLITKVSTEASVVYIV